MLISLEKHRRAAFFVAGCVLGAVCFLLTFGARVLDFGYDAWLLKGTGATGDLTQHYLGWTFLRDSAVSFPLGLIDGLCYPNRISAIYTDSIPLFGVFFQLFSAILPKTFQYFGLWGIICFTLQGGFAALILCKFSENRVFIAVGALFFIFSPLVLQRMFYHTALGGHFIILAALALWLYARECSYAKKMALWGGLCGLCVVVNLYFSPLVLGLLFCALLEEFLDGREVVPLLVIMGAAIAVTFGVMFLFGGFYGGVSGKMGGLGDFSFNLNGFFNGQGEAYFTKEQELAFSGQNEGFAYLGVGAMLMIALAAYLFKKGTRRLFPILLAAVVFTVLAISPIVTLDGKTLFEVPYPAFIHGALSTFRSSGRFIWVVYYMLLCFALYVLGNCDRKRATTVFVSVCAALQLIDLSPMLSKKREQFSVVQSYESPLKSNQWVDFGKRYKHIMFYAPLWDLYVTPNIAYTFAIFAKEHGMTLNGTYFSRDLSEQVNAITLQHFEDLRERKITDSDTLYIFPTAIPSGNYGLSYRTIDGFLVGIKKSK